MLKSQRKHLFIVCNSHVPFVDLAMSATLGPDWKDFFTIVLANCRKPLFWKHEGAFFVHNIKAQDRKGVKLVTPEALNQVFHERDFKVLLEGNAGVLTKFFQNSLGK